MTEYNKAYLVTTNSGHTYQAYFRKGETYDWWEDVKIGDEIYNVVKYEQIITSNLNEKQLRLINWMFNYCKVEMLRRNDEHTKTDIEKLTNYIKERFPEQADNILSLDYLI